MLLFHYRYSGSLHGTQYIFVMYFLWSVISLVSAFLVCLLSSDPVRLGQKCWFCKISVSVL